MEIKINDDSSTNRCYNIYTRFDQHGLTSIWVQLLLFIFFLMPKTR